ncbi:MAG TPA: potassium transporter Kup [Thermoanaerobaculia bacterium]|nr:potassium transporter Kup [Thermoanaerobaculia bacterium]
MSGGHLATLCLTALGIVYGDIGTSPLYALRECFAGEHGVPPTPANVLGVLSLVFWSLVIIVTLKYHVYVLRLGNRGEGGILALMGLVQRRGKKRTRLRVVLVLLGVFGAALLYGDGIITPAISVLSAVEGLEVATHVFEPYVVPITIVILLTLFLFQRHGTAGIGSVFGPVMLLWFVTIGVLGVASIVRHPAVLAAMSPAHAWTFFRQNGGRGFLVLGAVFLVATGGEALYADLGHFGERPIQIDWFGLVGLSLTCNYFGQGALLIHDPQAVSNPFFRLGPAWALYPLIVLATLATIIASQAIISGAFSLTYQAVRLEYLPRMEVVHTSETEKGQIYIPVVNRLLAGLTIALVLAFQRSANLAAAYGMAVTTTMVITTILAGVVSRERFGWSVAAAAAVTVGFLVVDLAFFGANLAKIGHGGWFPLLVAAVVFTVMTTWREGRRLLNRRLRDVLIPLEKFIAEARASKPATVPGTAVYLSIVPDLIPGSLRHNFDHNHVLHEKIVLLTVVTEEVARVEPEKRVETEPIDQRFRRVLLHFGYKEDPDIARALDSIEIPGVCLDPEKTSFFLGKESIVPTRKKRGMVFWREKLFVFLNRNAWSALSAFCLPPEQSIEIRGQIEL